MRASSTAGSTWRPPLKGRASAREAQRRRRRNLAAGTAAVLLVAGLVACLVTALAGGGSNASGAPKADGGLVGYPSYLPKSTLHVPTDSLLLGTMRRPALASEGDVVKVITPHWSALATVSGPEVPGEGLPYQTPATTCTWTVRIWKATGPVPISVSDFDSIDNLGNVYRPYLVTGEPSPPKVLGAGRSVTFELRAGTCASESRRVRPIEE